MATDTHNPPVRPAAPEHRLSYARLFGAHVGIGIVFGLLLGACATITGFWPLVLSPVLVFANRYLVLRARAAEIGRSFWAWPVTAIVVASAVVVIVPASAVPAVVVVAVVLLPVFLVVAAVVDARAEVSVWRH